MRFHCLPLLAALMALSSCSVYSLQELRQATPRGTPFQTALAVKYLEFADAEEKAYDWPSSWHFADKGLTSAYGQDVEPENPDDWNEPKEMVAELRQAHEALLLAITPQAKESLPQAAAEAVFFYDCWVEQQGENWQEDDIAYCRENFQSAMLSLAAGSREASGQSVSQHGKRSSYLVYFGWNRAELDAAAERIVQSIVEDLRSHDAYDVVLNGHTDRTGAAKFNMGLSRQRAENVKAALVARGIPSRRISTYGFGETDPRKRTKSSRRVEVFVN